jgi:hypothetical protein
VKKRALAAGTHYLFVEAPDRLSAGLVDVSVAASPATPPPPNDTCAAPELIVLPTASTVVNVNVDTSAAGDDYTGSCNNQPLSPEVVFQLHVAAKATYVIDVAASSGSFATPVVYLRTPPCDFPSVVVPPPDSGIIVDAGTELGCSLTGIQQSLDPGDYFIYVEGYGLTGAGPTTLTVSSQ